MPWRRRCWSAMVRRSISQRHAEHVRWPMDDAILELHLQGWRRVSKRLAGSFWLKTFFPSRLTASRETFSLRRRVFRRLFYRRHSAPESKQEGIRISHRHTRLWIGDEHHIRAAT